ncbi:MAG: hypothetical protein E6F97_09190, partial [Actinobacteria bacterium]
MPPARTDQLRQGSAWPARARLAQDGAGAVPQRAGRVPLVSRGLELAERAVRAAEGDEAQAIVRRERSGLARYASSEVHQPTLVENEVVELQVVRDGRLGIAIANRPGEDGLRELAARAAEAAGSAPADPDFPGLVTETEPAQVEAYDEE